MPVDCKKAEKELCQPKRAPSVISVPEMTFFMVEPAAVAVLEKFIAESGYAPDFTDKRRHPAIYPGDPRKTAPEKLKTVIRYPIKRI